MMTLHDTLADGQPDARARILGLGDRTGALRPGLAADLVVCDEAFRLHAVMRHGEWVGESP